MSTSTGVSTANLPTGRPDEVIANEITGTARRTVRASVGNLGQMLLASGPIADAISGIASGFGVYQTYASLAADLAPPVHAGAWVIGDAAAGANGIYRKTGAAGTGAWVRAGDLPYGIIGLSVSSGTNAIVATSVRPVPLDDLSAILLLSPIGANTGAVTIEVNGAAPVSLLSSTGSELAAGSLDGGRIYPLVQTAGHLRALVDGDFAVAVDQATAAATACAAAAVA